MNVADIPAGLALCRSAGWNQLSRDWEILLRLSPDGCLACVDRANRLVGTVATVSYEQLTWIGMVLVHPEKRRQGIGTTLLQKALAMLPDTDLVKLDATPSGREVYLRLNFADEYQIARMQAPWPFRHVPEVRTPPARPMTGPDLQDIVHLDREVFGADRLRLLGPVLDASPEFAFVTRGDKGTGYCFGRHGHAFSHIGPVIATETAAAKSVFSAAMNNCKGPVITDALHHSPEWIAWLRSLGFAEQRKLIRMYRGRNTRPGLPEKQFCIFGPEFG